VLDGDIAHGTDDEPLVTVAHRVNSDVGPQAPAVAVAQREGEAAAPFRQHRRERGADLGESFRVGCFGRPPGVRDEPG
jgi:hypothetical protein